MEPREIEVTASSVANLTVGEIELIEDKTGKPINFAFTADAPKGTVLHAMAHIVLTREAKDQGEPLPKWEETGDVIVRLAAEVEATTTDPTVARSVSGRGKRRSGS